MPVLGVGRETLPTEPPPKGPPNGSAPSTRPEDGLVVSVGTIVVGLRSSAGVATVHSGADLGGRDDPRVDRYLYGVPPDRRPDLQCFGPPTSRNPHQTRSQEGVHWSTLHVSAPDHRHDPDPQVRALRMVGVCEPELQIFEFPSSENLSCRVEVTRRSVPSLPVSDRLKTPHTPVEKGISPTDVGTEVEGGRGGPRTEGSRARPSLRSPDPHPPTERSTTDICPTPVLPLCTGGDRDNVTKRPVSGSDSPSKI